MSWLSELRKYTAKYDHAFQASQFSEVSSVDGPGMGAAIKYSNGIFQTELINDRSQYFVNLIRIGSADGRYDIAPFLALIKHMGEKGAVQKLGTLEKEKYWEIPPNFNDPLKDFFQNLDKIAGLMSDQIWPKTKNWIEEYYKGRGDWIIRGLRKSENPN